jgi:hypothetical protein
MPSAPSSPVAGVGDPPAASSAAALSARYAALFGGPPSGPPLRDSAVEATEPAAAASLSVDATVSVGTGAHDGESRCSGLASVDLSLFPGGFAIQSLVLLSGVRSSPSRTNRAMFEFKIRLGAL